MLLLLLLQSLLLFALAALVFYWRIQTNQSIARLTAVEAERTASMRNTQSALANLQSELAGLQEAAREWDRMPKEPALTVPDSHPPPGNTLSLAKRSQALKMIRRGETVETIAAAVGAPASQIRLLQKVRALMDAA
jgi:hypothetical protein